MSRRGIAFSCVLSVAFMAARPAAGGQTDESGWPPTPPPIEVERLSSGVRLVHLASPEDPGAEFVDLAFGFAPEVPVSAADRATHQIVTAWLIDSVPARSVALIAHLAGGTFESIRDADLVGVRVRVPREVTPVLVGHAAEFLGQRMSAGPLLDYELAAWDLSVAAAFPESRQDIDQVITWVATGADSTDAVEPADAAPEPDAVLAYFRGRFGTDRAWVVSSVSTAGTEFAPLGGIGARPASAEPRATDPELPREAAEMTLPSRSPGAVIIGSGIEGVFYEGWFNALVIDRALRQSLDRDIRLDFRPSPGSVVHLIEAAVDFPDYPREVADSIVAGIEALRTDPEIPTRLPGIKEDALRYLSSRRILEWFAARDLWGPLGDGWARVWSLTEAEFRASAGAFLGSRRVTALRAPAFEAPVVAIGTLTAPLPVADPEARPQGVPGRVPIPELSGLRVRERSSVTVDRLDSGVGLATGEPAVFVAGDTGPLLPDAIAEVGPNGTLWRLADVPGDPILAALAGVRADRLLFFVPAGERDRYRRMLGTWSGGATDATDATGQGDVATSDLPALIILKVWLETRVIESGWSGRVGIRIAGTEGSRLSVETDPARLEVIGEWLAEAEDVFAGEQGESDFRGLLEAAGAYFEEVRRDLQILLFQRAPSGEILPPGTVSPARFRSMLGAYF